MKFFSRILNSDHHRFRISMFNYEQARKKGQKNPTEDNINALVIAAEHIGEIVKSDLQSILSEHSSKSIIE